MPRKTLEEVRVLRLSFDDPTKDSVSYFYWRGYEAEIGGPSCSINWEKRDDPMRDAFEMGREDARGDCED